MAVTFIVACLFVHLGVTFGIIYQNHNYGMNTDLQDHVCQQNDVVFNVKLASILICAAKCAQTSDCRSHMYNSVDKDCIGCREKYMEVGQMTSDTRFKYYGDVTKNYHERCDVTIDCNELETICELNNKICVCTPGYSFLPSNKTCVSSCSTYGNTYEEYTERNVISHNDYDEQFDVSFEWCKNFCNSKPKCRSYERYDTECSFSDTTALQHPESYVSNPNINYYNRNCA